MTTLQPEEKTKVDQGKDGVTNSYEDGKLLNDLRYVAAGDVWEHMTLLRRYGIEVRVYAVKCRNFIITL